jgi:seryl-tRNA synthetase
MRNITLERPVPREFQAEIVKNLYWIDAGLEAFEFDPADGRRLLYRYRGPRPPEQLDHRLKDCADRLARSLHALPSKTLYENNVRPRGLVKPYEALCAQKWVKSAGHGTHVYRGLFLELYHALDAHFRRQALQLRAEDYKFPALIQSEVLARTGYLDGFPHNANFVCHLPEQAELVEQFKARVRTSSDRSSPAFAADFGAVTTALCPTVCYHFYHCHQNSVIPPDDVWAGTAVSACYRYEGKAMTGLRRLREFNMREIIFLGASEQVLSRRAALLDLQKQMLEKCELQSVIRTASDPFFLDDYDRKRLFQIGFDLKYEVQAWLPEENEWLAIGSVNYHQDHFGQAFHIRLESGEAAHSCCLGFGLDRWCLAIFAQHGLEPEQWPRGVQELLEQCHGEENRA